MIIITLKDLIPIIPDFINLFLSGFIFMSTYNWLNSKKIDITLMTVWSLLISILVRSFYSTLHTIIFSNIEIYESIKIIVFSVTGFILAVICTYLRKTKTFTKILFKINNKSINDDIFDDIIDYDKRTMMRIYIKSSNVYYLGRLAYREENGTNSWISLIDYCSVDKDTDEPIFDPDESNYMSSVAINLNNIERIEIIYENDSDVWQRLTGYNTNNNTNNIKIAENME